MNCESKFLVIWSFYFGQQLHLLQPQEVWQVHWNNNWVFLKDIFYLLGHRRSLGWSLFVNLVFSCSEFYLPGTRYLYPREDAGKTHVILTDLLIGHFLGRGYLDMAQKHHAPLGISYYQVLILLLSKKLFWFFVDISAPTVFSKVVVKKKKLDHNWKLDNRT